jgi:hypothetical protein
MGYTLRIGELETTVTDDGLESCVCNEAEGKHLDEAPAFGEPTDHTNSRWPSYTAWHDFSRFVGLHDFFYDKSTGLIRTHPGCVPLKKEHKEILDEAYKEFYEKYPNAKAGYSPKALNDMFVEDKDWPEENNYAARLEWLKFWIDWALENCKIPVFYNS